MSISQVDEAEFFRKGKMTRVQYGGGDPKPEERPQAPGPTPPTLWAYTVLSEGGVRAIDPMLRPRGIVRLEMGATEGPVTVTIAGVDLLRLEPTDSGQAFTHLSLAMYSAIVESLGNDDEPEACDRWTAEAEAWARDMLLHVPNGAVAVWRKEHVAAKAMIAARLHRSWGLSLPEVDRIVGLALTSPRGLWPTNADSKRLDERARLAREAAEKAAEEERARIAELQRPKNCRELGIQCVAVKKSRATSEGVIDWTTREIRAELQPFPLAPLSWETTSSLFFAWRSAEDLGLSLPTFDADGIRSLSPDDVASPAHPVQEASQSAIAFVKAMRARHMKDFELGPVPEDRWSEKGLEQARALARRYARALNTPLSPWGWQGPAMLSAIVRSLCVRPDQACAVILEARDGSADFWQTDLVGAACVRAALGSDPGGASVGSLLEPDAPPSLHETTTPKSKKAK